jgi:hypothetical protein
MSAYFVVALKFSPSALLYHFKEPSVMLHYLDSAGGRQVSIKLLYTPRYYCLALRAKLERLIMFNSLDLAIYYLP